MSTIRGSNGQTGIRMRRACTSCRQVKLRCDNVQTYPAPCSRCKKNSLQCYIDPDFKRTPTRHRLDELTGELSDLKRALESRSIPPASPAKENSLSYEPGTAEDDTLRPAVNFDHVETTSDSFVNQFFDITDLPDRSVCIGGIEIPSFQAASLFEHFCVHYLGHCPILDTDRSINTIYRSSPFLFWTIIMISARWHSSFAGVYHMILWPYREMLAYTLLNPIRTVESIQALILLCFWPLAVKTQSDDPSWNYCGITTHAAMTLGFHSASRGCPGRSPSVKEMFIRSKTWLALVYINCFLSWKAGILVSSELLNNFSPLTHPLSKQEREFETRVRIQRQLARSIAFLNGSNGSTESYSFAQNLVSELESFRAESRGSLWSSQTEVLLLGAQLSLFTIQFERGSCAQPSFSHQPLFQEVESVRKGFINQAYLVAVKLIHTFSELVDTSSMPWSGSQPPQTSYSLRCLPKQYLGLLTLATCFILKAEANYPKLFERSKDLTQNQTRLSYTILSTWSDNVAFEGDEPGRAAKMISVVSRTSEHPRLEMKESTPEAVTGIGLIDDMILVSKNIRGKDSRRPILSTESQGLQGNGGPSSTTQANEPQTKSDVNIRHESFEIFLPEPLENLQESSLTWNTQWDLDFRTWE